MNSEQYIPGINSSLLFLFNCKRKRKRSTCFDEMNYGKPEPKCQLSWKYNCFQSFCSLSTLYQGDWSVVCWALATINNKFVLWKSPSWSLNWSKVPALCFFYIYNLYFYIYIYIYLNLKDCHKEPCMIQKLL